MRQFFHKLCYDKQDNPDEHVIGMLIGWLGLHAGVAWALYHGAAFDPLAYSTGFGAIGSFGGLGKYLAGQSNV